MTYKRFIFQNRCLMLKNTFKITAIICSVALTQLLHAQKKDSLLQRPSKMFYAKHKGYMGSVETGVLVGFEKVYSIPKNCYYCDDLAQRRENIAISLRTIHGYRFFPYLFIGGGVGFDRYTGHFQSFVPLFCRVQSEFLKRKITPFASVDAGYGFLVQENESESLVFTRKPNYGGVYVATSAGVRFYTQSRVSVALNIGYAVQKSRSTFRYDFEGSPVFDIYRTYQRMTAGVGIMF
jgi:hypothetical protein